MWKSEDSIQSVKNAFLEALKAIPEFLRLNALEKGRVIDANFKSMMQDLMYQFGIREEEYEVNLRGNEPGADFVIYSKEANDLIKDLLDGRITVVKEHTRVSKNGAKFIVKAHFKKVKSH